MGTSKTSRSKSITKADLDAAYKKGYVDGLAAQKRLERLVFLAGIEASKCIEWTNEEEEIKRVLKENGY